MKHKNLKFILILILTVLLILGEILLLHKCSSAKDLNSRSEPNNSEILSISESEIDSEPVSEVALNETPLLFSDVVYQETYDSSLITDFLSEVSVCIDQLDTALKSTNYTVEAQQSMGIELARLHNVAKRAQYVLDKYTVWENEYYYAVKTWQFFKQHGYSDAVTCAIIGNMMIETGGSTLNLKPTIYDSSGSFYGLCQWSLYYRPEIAGLGFEAQLDYLLNTIEQEFRTFGFCYYSDFTYEDFLNMDDPGEAAIAFAAVYERCASSSYDARYYLAWVAYEYFNLDF